MDNTAKIFLGNTPSENKKYILYFLKKTKYDKIIVPCVGQFNLAFLAIKAGYRPDQIETSDVSIYSTIIGYYLAGKPQNEIVLEMDETIDAIDDLGIAAHRLFWMKYHQIGDKNHERSYKDELLKNKEKYINQYKESLKKYKAEMDGITYEIADIRDILERNYDKNTLLLINPPAYKKGYEKQFTFGGKIKWDVKIEEFDWDKEFRKMYEASCKKEYFAIWYMYYITDWIDTDKIIHAFDKGKGKYYCWIINKEANIKKIICKKQPKSIGRQYRLLQDNIKITGSEKINIKTLSSEEADYYRDLMMHKLGTTGAELHCGIFIDGCLFGVAGFMIGRAMKEVDGTIFEVYGCNRSLENYENANRLLMMLITTREFAEIIKSNIRINRIWDIKIFRTTCLSKYRKVKLNNGLLKIVKREKIKGTYKILYETGIYERMMSEALQAYLDEERNKDGNEDD